MSIPTRDAERAKTNGATHGATRDASGAGTNKKKLILNAFAMNTPGHLSPGLWNHPRNKTYNYKKLDFWTDLARILDDAGFHALFLADVLGAYDGTYQHRATFIFCFMV
jgi:hypothetical protein